MHRSIRLLTSTLVVVLALSGVAGCSDEDSSSPDVSETTSTTADGAAGTSEPSDTTEAPAPGSTCTTTDAGPLRIVLVNDDGVINPAIDVMLDLFDEQTEMELDVTVVAPAEERSGGSDMTTPEGLTYTETTTPGGNTAYSVDGYPADSVIVALDQLDLDPQLVVSGINPGHNFGVFAAYSGTVGVGRTAIRRDIPALAVSAGPVFDQAQFAFGADLALDWITENCEALVAGNFQTDTVTSINIPACAPDQMGPVQEVPRALEMPEVPEGDNIFASSCDLSDPAPANDVAAVRVGFPSLTQVEPEL